MTENEVAVGPLLGPLAFISAGLAMQEAVAEAVVFPVLMHGLRLKERLANGDVPNLAAERAELMRRLVNVDTRLFADYTGEQSSNLSVTQAVKDPYLGIRYTLVAWLDEIFSEDEHWGEEYTKVPLEVELYGARLRATRFWEQAARAESRPTRDVLLELYYLCVMLGFRGSKIEDPEWLKEWVETTGNRVKAHQGGDWKPPPGRDPPFSAPPLRGREKLQRMVLVAGMVLLVFTPILALLAVIAASQ